jgi:gamma-glutamyltranspeptidase/glutathione hydrolase
LKDVPGFAEHFMPNGRAPEAGEKFAAPAHARTLKRIAETKGAAFYRGELAESMAAHSRKHGGAMTMADLAAHTADWVEPLAQDYRGYTLHEIPPNGQGIAAQMALGILEGFDLGAIPVDSADSLHLQIEAVKLAFTDIYEYVSDADTMRVRNADLLDKEYLRTRSRLIDMKKAQTPQYGVPASGGTVYLTAADATGMMVSYIQSNYQGLGSGIVVDGISMQIQLRAAARSCQRRRAAQAAVSHDHPCVRHAERTAGDEFRRDGRLDPAASSHASDGPAYGLPSKSPGGLGCAALAA